MVTIQQLYQKTSIAAQPFEEANIPDSFFDAVIGNVPFGDIRLPNNTFKGNAGTEVVSDL